VALDKFENLMDDMKGWTNDDLAKWVESNKPKCICPGCPTYTQCAEMNKEALYCVTGKSPSCIETPETCVCRDCPVFDELSLLYNYHCIEGSEEARRKL